MKTQSMLLAALASAPAALAHTIFSDFYVDGMPQGDGVAMRMSPNAETAGSPINGLNSEDMACNVGGTKGVSRVQPVSDGSLLTFEIREWANDPSKGAIDRGHYGPCAVYLKKVDSAVNDRAVGDGWFKLFDHGYDASTQRWCTDEIIDNNGLLSVNLPKGLAGGYYLARPEILALHNANKGDPQFYTGCAQIFLESNGDLGPQETVSIPGHVSSSEPGISFNIYNNKNSEYQIPGPKVANLVPGAATGSTSQTTQTEGLKPADCLVENANWCGKEVPSYSSEAGCWAASEDCYNQGETCWNSAPPTGNSGCELWQTKCKGIQNQCSAGNFNGPPNKGQVLTPAKSPRDVGKIMATVGGGIVDAPAPKTTATKKDEAKTETPAKPTDAAESPKDEEKEYDEPAPAPTAENTYEAPAPAPTAGDSYDAPEPAKDDKPEYTVTITSSAPGAPAPTAAPEACPKGWHCVTVYEVETVTQTVYVTAAYDSYKRSAHQRRHAHRH
ncbi:hypothetical protein IQ07DRAFT_500495 [Pyrenochaeta sp. DS3sAY3a]|nr:hypothetical protein IQ07DRAFT_500495 [Pyrenochaeta sp. DS3sAY3a]